MEGKHVDDFSPYVDTGLGRTLSDQEEMYTGQVYENVFIPSDLHETSLELETEQTISEISQGHNITTRSQTSVLVELDYLFSNLRPSPLVGQGDTSRTNIPNPSFTPFPPTRQKPREHFASPGKFSRISRPSVSRLPRFTGSEIPSPQSTLQRFVKAHLHHFQRIMEETFD